MPVNKENKGKTKEFLEKHRAVGVYTDKQIGNYGNDLREEVCLLDIIESTILEKDRSPENILAAILNTFKTKRLLR